MWRELIHRKTEAYSSLKTGPSMLSDIPGEKMDLSPKIDETIRKFSELTDKAEGSRGNGIVSRRSLSRWSRL